MEFMRIIGMRSPAGDPGVLVTVGDPGRLDVHEGRVSDLVLQGARRGAGPWT